MRSPRRLCYAALLLASLPAPAPAAEFFLKDGDRVVFYGDSITDQRLYTSFIETYSITRFPQWNLTFIHSGWGGDRVTGGGGGPADVRLERDVIAHKPTVVTIMLGMNDGGYKPFDQPTFDTYAKGYEHLVTTLKKAAPDLRMTLIAPSPYDDVTRPPTFEGGYNAVLIRYGQYVKELAEREHSGFADLNGPVVEATKRAYELDPQLAEKINPDRVHPYYSGQLLMATALLKAWNAPSVVTAVEIESSGAKLVKAENARVSDLKANDNVLSWTQDDSALPLSYEGSDPATRLVLRASDVLQALDLQSLTVTGLEGPEYRLKIDGQSAGVFTKEKLAEGINLAELPTPMIAQSRRVHALTLKHNNVHFARWRQVQFPLADQDPAKVKQALDALDGIEADIVREQRAAAQPKPHAYVLEPK
jgi:lysophospholipase L1-like esterase